MAYGNITAVVYQTQMYCIDCISKMICSKEVQLRDYSHLDGIEDWLCLTRKQTDKELLAWNVIGINPGCDLLLEGQSPYQYALEVNCCNRCQVLLADTCIDYGYEHVREEEIVIDPAGKWVKVKAMVVPGNMRKDWWEDAEYMTLVLLEYDGELALLDLYDGWASGHSDRKDFYVKPEYCLRSLFETATTAYNYSDCETYIRTLGGIFPSKVSEERAYFKYSYETMHTLIDLFGLEVFETTIEYVLEED